MTSPRFAIRHPMLTPEWYQKTPRLDEDRVRGLHIAQDRPTSPEVMFDTPEAIKDYIFGGLSTRCIHFFAGFHMYIPNAQGIMMLGENVIATHLMRLHYLHEFGVMLPDTIYGDVAVFGTGPVNRDYSVPYEIVEEMIHLYEKI